MHFWRDEPIVCRPENVSDRGNGGNGTKYEIQVDSGTCNPCWLEFVYRSARRSISDEVVNLLRINLISTVCHTHANGNLFSPMPRRAWTAARWHCYWRLPRVDVIGISYQDSLNLGS